MPKTNQLLSSSLTKVMPKTKQLHDTVDDVCASLVPTASGQKKVKAEVQKARGDARTATENLASELRRHAKKTADEAEVRYGVKWGACAGAAGGDSNIPFASTVGKSPLARVLAGRSAVGRLGTRRRGHGYNSLYTVCFFSAEF